VGEPPGVETILAELPPGLAIGFTLAFLSGLVAFLLKIMASQVNRLSLISSRKMWGTML
jgi:hypothetical protein